MSRIVAGRHTDRAGLVRCYCTTCGQVRHWDQYIRLSDGTCLISSHNRQTADTRVHCPGGIAHLTEDRAP